VDGKGRCHRIWIGPVDKGGSCNLSAPPGLAFDFGLISVAGLVQTDDKTEGSERAAR
jgi:hypothetical protein